MKPTTMFLRFSLAIAAAAALLISVGCVGKPHVPATKLAAQTDGWKVSIESPKDTHLQDLEVTKDTSGNVSVKLQSLSATNSPTVIEETGKAQAATIDAQGNVLDKAGNVIGKVVDGVVSYFGK